MNIRSLLFLVCFLLTSQKALSDALLRDVNHLLELTKLGEQFEYITNDQSQKIIRTYSSILNMSNEKVIDYIEIGPGKVLSGLIKRINKNVKINSINNESDIKELSL